MFDFNLFQSIGFVFLIFALGVFLLDRFTDLIPGIGWVDNLILMPLTLLLGVIGGFLVLFGAVVEKAVLTLALGGGGVYLYMNKNKKKKRR